MVHIRKSRKFKKRKRITLEKIRSKGFWGQLVKAGNIIVRQRGTKHNPGKNVYIGKDHTIHASIDGNVVFTKKKITNLCVSVVGL